MDTDTRKNLWFLQYTALLKVSTHLSFDYDTLILISESNSS